MKKLIVAVAAVVLLSAGSLYAQAPGQQKGPLAFGMTIDYGWPVGQWGNDGWDDFRSIMGQRVGILIDVGYRPLPFLAFGVETGVRLFYFDIEDEETGYDYGFFFDWPIRGFVRFGMGMFFLQAFGGYYLSWGNEYLQGAEIGLKASVIGITLEVSYIFGDPVNAYEADWYEKDYWRFSIGYRFSLM